MTYNFETRMSEWKEVIETAHVTKELGIVQEVTGLIVKGFLPNASIGSMVEIQPLGIDHKYKAEVVGFKDRMVLMMPLEETHGIGFGSKIELVQSSATIGVSFQLLGKVIDGLGNSIDGSFKLRDTIEYPIYNKVRNPLDRRPIREPLDLGVRAVNAALTLGKGQRVGIMAGSGVGKSVLMGMMARNSKADINVIALIGERGREVREFIENDLGPEGLKKSVVVVVTGDQSPLLRIRGAAVATAIAEFFSAQGKDVLLLVDSCTRIAMAQREIGLSVGEPPATKGYTPSVYSLLPKLLERAGSFEGEGSITGLYTVLVEGDDMDDPIGDAVRSIVDGHWVLNRRLAQSGHYPAVDILQSASRVMRAVTTPEHQKLAIKLRDVLATYRESEDLINIGAYKAGSNPKIDRAIKCIDRVNDFLKQSIDEKADLQPGLNQLQIILGQN